MGQYIPPPPTQPEGVHNKRALNVLVAHRQTQHNQQTLALHSFGLSAATLAQLLANTATMCRLWWKIYAGSFPLPK